MALLMGYSANASAIVFPSQDVDAVGSQPLFPTLRATFLFFLVARSLRLVFYIIYAMYLPKFRSALLWSGLGEFLMASPLHILILATMLEKGLLSSLHSIFLLSGCNQKL